MDKAFAFLRAAISESPPTWTPFEAEGRRRRHTKYSTKKMIIASAKIPPNTQPMIIPRFVDDADFTGAEGFNKGLPGRYLPKPKCKKDQRLVDLSSTYTNTKINIMYHNRIFWSLKCIIVG